MAAEERSHKQNVTMTPARKLRVLIGLSSDIFFRNFVDTHAFDGLGKRFEVFWFTRDRVKRSLPPLPGFTDVGRCETNPRHDRLRDHMRWVAVFAGHRRSSGLAIRRKYIQLRRKHRWVYTALSLPVVWRLAHRLVEARIGWNRSIARIFDRVRPDVVVFPSDSNDPFALDIVPIARKRRVPSVMIIYNWDNLNTKGLIRVEPDRLCVWGEDMAEIARKVHRLRPEQINVTGAAHFEQYFDSEQKAAAGQIAEQNVDGLPRLLFAGNRMGHADAKYLIDLDEAIEVGRLPRLKIIYRPHPWRLPRQDDKKFEEYRFRHIEMDPQLAKLFGADMKTRKEFAPSMDYNAQLLQSVKGVMTPFSTISLEAALVGVPILQLNLFEDGHLLKYEVDHSEHLRRICRHVPGVLRCDDDRRLIQDVFRLLELSAAPTLPARMREAVKPIVYYDSRRSYAERLADVIDELVGRNQA